MSSAARPPVVMRRSGSQGSDGSRSGDSMPSPTTVGTLYTPETVRFLRSGASRAFNIAPDASPQKPESAFDVTALRNSLNASMSHAALSATANTFTPANSKLAQLTATSTPDDTFTTTRAANPVSGMASSSTFNMPVFDLSHKITSNGKGKMPAAQPVSDPNATRYMLVKTHSPEGLAAIVDIIKDAVAQKDFVAAMIPTTSSGGAMAYRFDSIRDAAAAVAAARDYLPGPAVQIAFINSTTYKQFDPSLMDLNEGTITFLIQASLPAAELRVAAVDEAGRFGVVHSNEVLREDRNFLSLKIIFDSVKAAEFAVKELTGAKAGYMRQGATIQAVRFQGASFLGMNKIRNDSTQLTGDGVKLNPGYAMNGANFFDTSSLNGSSSAIAPLRTQGPIFDQPSLHFSGAYGVNYPPRAGPSGLMPAYGAFNHTSGMMGKGPRGNRNSNPVDLNRIMEGSDIRTTIMLRNIPNKMTAAELKQIIDKTSFGRYDFSYLRIDFHNQCNVGYAFINFTKPEYIIPFFQEHNGRPWGLYNSDKIAELSYATRQGLMSLIDLFQNSCVMEEIPEHRPKLWYTEVDGAWCGQEKPFPAPTNLQKLQRSRDMAATVGLYPPRGNRGFHHDERHRMSQYDRGTPQAIRDAQLNMAAYHGMGYPAMAPGFPAMGGPFTYPYGYPPVSPFFPPYHM